MKNRLRGSAWGFCSFLLVCLVSPITITHAAQWNLIVAGDKSELEVDQQSAKPGKGAWFRFIRTPARDESCGYGKKVAYSKEYVEANCKEFTLRTKQSISYGEDGDVLPHCTFDSPKAAFTEFAPETLGEAYFRAICHPSGRYENRDAIAIREAKASRDRPVRKALGVECVSSSECEGTLLCAKSAGGYMRCMTSADAWRASQQ